MKHMFMLADRKCKFCGQDAIGKTTTQCPEVKLCDDIAKRVQSGQLDFVHDSWVGLEPKQEEAKPKVTVVDSLSSLFEFMEAMVPELSPEASDELTDEDIDLLKSINSFPLPRRMVRDLELPVELMVSLHKLKRLDYVRSYNESNSYQVTDKGEELLDSLKPKPVQLDILALSLMVHMYVFESIGTPTGSNLTILNWLIENTRFVYTDCSKPDHWTLTPIGKEFIDDILNKELLFI